MSNAPAANPIRVAVSADGMEATLLLASEVPGADACRAALSGAGVALTPAVSAAVDALLATKAEPGKARSAVVARGLPPKRGGDAKIEWIAAPGAPPQPVPAAPVSGDDKSSAGEFYTARPFVPVRIGQVLGKVIATTPGTEGRDVRNRVVAPAPGKPPQIAPGSGLIVAGDKVVAQADGRFYVGDGGGVVRPVLEITEIDEHPGGELIFKGDVIAHKGLRDRFGIHTHGSIDAIGRVGSARIECGGDLFARAGILGRERGTLKIAGSVLARYLAQVQGTILGDLRVERELVHCNLLIGGELVSPGGTIVGGSLTVTGRVEAACLGGAGARTRLVLGTVPFAEQQRDQLAQAVTKFASARDAAATDLKKLTQFGTRMTAQDRERQTEVMFELQTNESNLNKATLGVEMLKEQIRTRTKVDLTILERIAGESVIVIRGDEFVLREGMRGPIRVFIGENGQPMLQRRESEPESLAPFQRAQSAA